MILSILALESVHSIRFLYRHFLSGITEKSLNVFYYVCSYAKADYSRFMNTTARIALHLIPEEFKDQPVFLCIDDTMVSKFGMKFENVSKLFDHAAHNGSSCLNGHSFVSIMLCIPVKNHDHALYLSVPLGYRKGMSVDEASLYVMEQIQKKIKVRDFINTSYDFCTGSHVGPDTIALFFLGKDRELSQN